MYICLPAWGYICTYMCNEKTWLLFEIRHLMSPLSVAHLHIRIVGTLTQPHTEAAFCVT